MARTTPHAENFPGLHAHSTGGFSTPTDSCIQCSYQHILRTGAPGGGFPEEMHTRVIITGAVLLQGSVRRTGFSTWKASEEQNILCHNMWQKEAMEKKKKNNCSRFSSHLFSFFFFIFKLNK